MTCPEKGCREMNRWKMAILEISYLFNSKILPKESCISANFRQNEGQFLQKDPKGWLGDFKGLVEVGCQVLGAWYLDL